KEMEMLKRVRLALLMLVALSSFLLSYYYAFASTTGNCVSSTVIRGDCRVWSIRKNTSGSYTGIAADITVGNPQIRDNSSQGSSFSAAVLWIGGSGQYLEIGWRKTLVSGVWQVLPYVERTEPCDGTAGLFGSALAPGSTHNFRLENI